MGNVQRTSFLDRAEAGKRMQHEGKATWLPRRGEGLLVRPHEEPALRSVSTGARSQPDYSHCWEDSVNLVTFPPNFSSLPPTARTPSNKTGLGFVLREVIVQVAGASLLVARLTETAGQGTWWEEEVTKRQVEPVCGSQQDK